MVEYSSKKSWAACDHDSLINIPKTFDFGLSSKFDEIGITLSQWYPLPANNFDSTEYKRF